MDLRRVCPVDEVGSGLEPMSSKMSPSRSRLWTRTSVGSLLGIGLWYSSSLPTSPIVSARCGIGSLGERNAMRLNAPSGVVIFEPSIGSMRSTIEDLASRYSMICLIEHILMVCCLQNSARSGTRIMRPSGWTISIPTQPGLSPASLQRSTMPSV